MRERPVHGVCGIAAACLLLAWACGTDSGPRDPGTRAVVIGIDGADWKVIDALAAEGGMPNLSRLRERGTSGPIETLRGIALSPAIWTSVATGKTVDKHGIAWFLVDRADGTRVPVRSYNRTSLAIWNILADAGRKAIVIGWWATYPAENVGRGVIVSDAFGYHGFGATARDAEADQKAYPAPRTAEFESLMPEEADVPREFAQRFIRFGADDYERERFDSTRSVRPDSGNPVHLFQEYAITAQGYTAISESLLERETFDLFMLYFEQVDSLSHLFMKYAPPKLPWVEQESFERYRDLVAEWYRYQDELLGRLLERIDLEKTAVFVLSDHGFKSGERRIRSEHTIDPRKAHLDHERHGIFIAAGPHIRRDVEIEQGSVLDITPTLLHYLGLPVARDMDGRVLNEILDPGFREDHPIRYVETYEDKSGLHGEPVPPEETEERVDPQELAEQMRRLRSLGYVGPGDASEPNAQGGESSPELHNNLGRVHLAAGKLDAARREFEKALALDPQNAQALLNLGMVRRARGRIAEAEHYVKLALQVDPDSVSALAQLGEIRRERGDLSDSIRLYREALNLDDSNPSVHLGLGDSLQRAGLYEDAERVFATVLELDPDSFEGHYNLGVTHQVRGRLDEAVPRFEKALELHPDHPRAALALNNLGDIYARRGQTEKAMESFRQAADASPAHWESRFNLAMMHLERAEPERAVELLEEASRIVPDHEQVNGRLGMTYLSVGRNDDAYRRFSLVRRLFPRNWIAPLGMALVRAGAGQSDDARELLRTAVELGGDAARTEAANYRVLDELQP